MLTVFLIEDHPIPSKSLIAHDISYKCKLQNSFHYIAHREKKQSYNVSEQLSR
jgi:hypothetical protein